MAMPPLRVRAGLVVAGLVLAGAFAAAPPALADPDALWRIAHDQCVPTVAAGALPPPCVAVDLAPDPDRSVAIVKDRVGVAQMLAIPTRRIEGVEDPQLLARDAPPLFVDAWKAKKDLEARLGGKELPREAVALAINSAFRRSQNQAHVHVDCVRPDVAAALATAKAGLDDQWRPMPAALAGRAYLARRLLSEDLGDSEPLLGLVAAGVPGARSHMDAMTLAVVGAAFDGKPGFILLANSGSPDGGGHAEDLQDHDCAIARSAP